MPSAVIVGSIVIMTLIGFFGLYMNVRNDWIYKKRDEVINRSMIENHRFVPYDDMPSYDWQLFHFWIWNFDKLMRK